MKVIAAHIEEHVTKRMAAKDNIRAVLDHLARMAEIEIKFGSEAWGTVPQRIDEALADLEIL